MKVFISYAVKDIASYMIPEIVAFLDKQSIFERVFYWERDCIGGKSILDYMKESIKQSDAVIVFCSENAEQSQPVQQEIGMAMVLDKLIIPIWAELAFHHNVIPPNLRDRRGHVYPTDLWYRKEEDRNQEEVEKEFKQFCDKLYFLLTGDKARFYMTEKDVIEILYEAKKEGIKNPKVLKLMLVGDGGVGKSAVLVKYIANRFIEDMHMTRGVDFCLKNINLDENHITLQIWDCGGQERYKFMLESYFLGAHGVMLFYDLTRFMSTTKFEEWIELVERGAGKRIPILVVGNKVDCEDDICVNQEDIDEIIEELAKKNEVIGHILTSAKSGQGINEAFNLLSHKILQTDDDFFFQTVRGFLGT